MPSLEFHIKNLLSQPYILWFIFFIFTSPELEPHCFNMTKIYFLELPISESYLEPKGSLLGLWVLNKKVTFSKILHLLSNKTLNLFSMTNSLS